MTVEYVLGLVKLVIVLI